MSKQSRQSPCSVAAMPCAQAYQVEAIITVDARGQMVLPKHTRDKAGLRAGDKLALVTWKKDGKTCCISLIKAELLAEMVKDVLGPMANEI